MVMSPVESMSYKVDWFQCTESSLNNKILTVFNSKFWKFLELIGYKFDNFDPASPRYFYNTGLSSSSEGISIYYDDPNKEVNSYSPKNVLFVMTGTGSSVLAIRLSEYFKIDDFEEVWYEFFKIVNKLKLKLKRIDIALDDFNNFLSFEKMERKLKQRAFRSSKHTYNIVKDRNTNNEVKGETLYLGTRKRHQDGYLIRFYDKYAEFKSKGGLMPRQVEDVLAEAEVGTKVGTHKWQRYEIEIHGKACMKFIEQVLGGMSFGMLYKGLMKNAIEFLKVSRSNKNRNYWKVCDWWTEFLDGAEKCSLAEPFEVSNFNRTLKWLRLAVLPSIKVIDEVLQSRGLDFYDLMKETKVLQFSKRQEQLKNDALAMSDSELDSYIEQFKQGEY